MSPIRLILFVVLIPSSCRCEESYLDVVYQSAAIYWSQGQFQAAVNQWFKYLDFGGRIETETIRRKIPEVKKLYEQGREKLRKQESVPPALLPMPVQKINPQRPVVSETSIPVGVASKDPALAKLLMEKAEKAEYSGHFEESRRLLRLALQCNPDNLSLRKKIEELNRMFE